jgi:glutathione S-transferase
MLQVLGRSTSINVRKVLWLCAELDLPFTHAEWGLGDLSVRSEEFRALNPNGLVPVIRDEGFVLWESNAICRYLAARHHRDDLLPVELQPRARVEQWLDWQTTELNTSWRYAFLALVRKTPAYTDRGAVEASIASWNRHMQILEAQLQRTGAFVTGGHFTLADIAVGLSTHRWYMTPIERPRLDAVEAFYERLSTRPAFLKHGRNGVP